MTDGFMAYIMFDNNLITGIAEKTKARSDISKFGTITVMIVICDTCSSKLRILTYQFQLYYMGHVIVVILQKDQHNHIFDMTYLYISDDHTTIAMSLYCRHC